MNEKDWRVIKRHVCTRCGASEVTEYHEASKQRRTNLYEPNYRRCDKHRWKLKS